MTLLLIGCICTITSLPEQQTQFVAPSLPDTLTTASGKHARVRHPWSMQYNPKVVELLKLRCHEQVECTKYDLYEFGVFTGRSMKGYVTQLKDAGVNYAHYWGFDSFVGLPQERGTIARSTISTSDWQAGSFSAAEVLRKQSYTSLESTILSFVNDSRVNLVRGFYNESLTRTIAFERQMQPALFVEIDCDLYVSSITAMDWMLANRLIVAGTLLVYNDWRAGGDGSGEALAHGEVCAKYNVTATRVPSKLEVIWRVEHVGRLA